MNPRQLLAGSFLSVTLGFAPLGMALAQSQPGDPPTRVGRLAETSGTVSFHTADATQWQQATLNYPVTSGNSFWTEPRSHAAIDVGASRIYLDSSTELDLGNLDNQSVVASLGQGAIFIRVSQASGNDQYEIDTPRGAVHIVQPGSYEIVAGDSDHPTTVTAFEGSAQIVGQDVNSIANPQQAVYLSGQNPVSAAVNPPASDDFVRLVQEEERPYQNAGQTPQYVSPQETGYQDLNRYGQWRQTPDYGPVWAPQVAAGWAPYRDGHWAYVAPWGWTWVDDAPWGFTPFHYGRWVEIDSEWCWTPGVVVEEPVYAPALVSFFGGIDVGGLSIGFSVGPSVGWVPLGPDEVYVPYYRASPDYIRNVNITNVRNETTIINVVNNNTVINNYNNYRNHDGATFVSADAMTGSRPIGPAFGKLSPDQRRQFTQRWANERRTGANPPVKPTWKTEGVTPRLAQQVGLPPPADGQSHSRPIAPGPNVAGNGKWQQFTGGGHNGTQQTAGTGLQGQPQGQFKTRLPGQNNNAQNWTGQTINGQNGGKSQALNGNGQFQPQGSGQGLKGFDPKLPPLRTGQRPGDSSRFVKGQLPPIPPASQSASTGGFGQGQTGQGQQLGQGGGATWLKNGSNKLGAPGPVIPPPTQFKNGSLAQGQQWNQPRNWQNGSGNQNWSNLPQSQQQNLKRNWQNGNGNQNWVNAPQGQQLNQPRNWQNGNGNQNWGNLPQSQQQNLKRNWQNGNGNQNWANAPQGQQWNQPRNRQNGNGNQSWANAPQGQQWNQPRNWQNGNGNQNWGNAPQGQQWNQPRNWQNGNGNQNWGNAPQGQQWNQPRNWQNGGSGQSDQKTRQNQPNKNGTIPLYNN